jgi:4-carboxymuconolactone decarboxylase
MKGVVAMSKIKLEEGARIRQAVLGKELADKMTAEVDEFSQPFQELVVEYCWGTVWTRTELPLKIRSLINLGILTALNRSEQLRTHIRGAINTGCTKDEIREVFLQTAVYCGIPAAVNSFRIAKEVFAELPREA